MYIDPARLRTAASGPQLSLDSIHQMIRVSTNNVQLAKLLDQYIVAAAIRAQRASATQTGGSVAAPFIPGGSVLSAAVSGIGGGRP